jgi:hypothetical protein
LFNFFWYLFKTVCLCWVVFGGFLASRSLKDKKPYKNTQTTHTPYKNTQTTHTPYKNTQTTHKPYKNTKDT